MLHQAKAPDPACPDAPVSRVDLSTQPRKPADTQRTAVPSAANLESYASIEDIIEELQPTEPVFCIDPFEIRAAVARFLSFPGRPLYAVKCNSHPFVLETLFDAGIRDFDVASLGEIEQIEGLFGKAAGLYFNNPAKTRPAIRKASTEYGVRFYTADCIEEVDKILEEADLSDELIVAVRLHTPGRNARYVLSTKFGAPPDEAVKILKYIHKRGVKAGISFHVGSQCLSPGAFGKAMSISGSVARKAGVPISVLNVGGGFPAPYPGDKIATLQTYFSHVIHGARPSISRRATCFSANPAARSSRRRARSSYRSWSAGAIACISMTGSSARSRNWATAARNVRFASFAMASAWKRNRPISRSSDQPATPTIHWEPLSPCRMTSAKEIGSRWA